MWEILLVILGLYNKSFIRCSTTKMGLKSITLNEVKVL